MCSLKGGCMKITRTLKVLMVVFISVCLLVSAPVGVSAQSEGSAKNDPLSSWNETPAKKRILDFIASVSDPASPSFVSEKERIAAFDLDGTLFCEKPLYLQVLIAAERLYDLAEKDPNLRDNQPYKGAWNRDMEYISDPKNYLRMNLIAFEGVTEEEYKEYCLKFLNRDHPVYGVPYVKLFYVPMEELLELLRASGFQLYLVSGSPQEFIRSFSEETLDIGLERVIGDTISVKFEVLPGNNVVFVRKGEVVEPEVLREGKPENIRMRIGRSAILTFGNSNDDIAMLESAGAGGLPHLSLTLHHDDKKREYAYDKGAQKVLKTAKQRNWVIVSMKDDFKTMFSAVEPAVKKEVKK